VNAKKVQAKPFLGLTLPLMPALSVTTLCYDYRCPMKASTFGVMSLKTGFNALILPGQGKIHGRVLIHALTLCRVMVQMLLAAFIVGGMPHINAITLQRTEDGLSVAGMFFAKLETFHAQLMSGDMGQVRLQVPSQCVCIMHRCRHGSTYPS
jgi:hypothetical protein